MVSSSKLMVLLLSYATLPEGPRCAACCAAGPAAASSRFRSVSPLPSRSGIGGYAGGGGRAGSSCATGVGMKRSRSPIFQESSLGTEVAEAGTAVESVRLASVQSSPDSWLTNPLKEICTFPVLGRYWMS